MISDGTHNLSLQVDEKPSEDYSDVGGLDKQIKELVEAIVLPVTHKDKFKALGIRPPKGLLYNGQLHLAWQSQECHKKCQKNVRAWECVTPSYALNTENLPMLSCH